MFFNSRSLAKLALVSAFALETNALVLRPIPDPSQAGSHQTVKRATIEAEPITGFPNFGEGQRVKRSASPIEMVPISDPGVLTHGRSLKREAPLEGCFNPHKQSTFFWGAYAGDNIYVANFTLSAPKDNEFILPVENFAKRMKSISCGPGKPMILEFSDKDSLAFAQSAWKWIDQSDVNHFTLVTEPNQCFQGDDRSPYLVSAVKFDEAKLTATIDAVEKEWHEVADEFTLRLGHEYVNPATANVTHPHLRRRGEGSTMDISHSFNAQLFDFAKDSKETAGMGLRADAEITTAGSLIADFEIEKTLGIIPKDINIKIHPQDVHADMLLKLDVDGRLGKALDWTMKPEIEIPVGALNIKKLLEIGPFVTIGVHFGSSALEGTGTMSAGVRGKLKNEAEVSVKLRNPSENSISNWKPDFERIDPAFSAEIGGDIRAWSELGIRIQAKALGKWGYQASVDAQLPYFEARMAGIVDSVGVCESKKTLGVKIDTNVGIDVNLNAGQVNESPDFEKELFNTNWPLFSTCIGVGEDNAKPTDLPEPTPTETAEAEPTAEPTEPPVETPVSTEGPVETGTSGPLATGTGIPLITGTGTVSAGAPMMTANSTFLHMEQRRPTALYF